MQNINEKADRLLLSRMHRGKTYTARLVDSVVCVTCAALIFYVLCYLLTRENFVSVLLSVLLTATCISAAQIFYRARMRRSLLRQRRHFTQEYCAQLLCVAPQEQFRFLMHTALSRLSIALCDDGEHVVYHEKTLPVSFLRLPSDEKVLKRDLLQLPQKEGLLVVTAPCASDLRFFAEKIGFCAVVDLTQLHISAFYHPKKEDVSNYILETLRPVQKPRTPFWSRLLDARRAKGYLLCGTFLLVASLFTLYPTYYRLSAAACIALAVAAFLLGVAQARQTSRQI